jgi:hypothetical protein
VLAGPVAAAIGREATLLAAAAVCLVCWGTMLSFPSVWSIRGRPDDQAAEPLPVPQTPAEKRLAFDP